MRESVLPLDSNDLYHINFLFSYIATECVCVCVCSGCAIAVICDSFHRIAFCFDLELIIVPVLRHESACGCLDM